MERLAIKSNLVTPILKDGQLFGLLIAHQCSSPHVWQQSEINFLKELAIRVGLALERVNFLAQKEAETERAQNLNEIISHIRDARTLEEIYQATVTGVRETLKTDRAVVYLFDENWQGSIVAESVSAPWTKALGTNIADPCFAEQYVEKYKQGRVKAVENIYQAGLTQCYLGQLEPFQVKANLVAPILAEKKLQGLLVTHQCSSPRAWQESEITFFKQVATQVGLAIDRMDFLAQIEQARQTAENLAQEQRQQKEMLQHQLLELLSDVEGAAQGDLTVRADVTVGEIGTVADFFNAVIESLREIVTQVKKAATQVNASLGQNEGAIRQLSSEALQQAQETTRTLDSVERMTRSIQQVAENARQAAQVARLASSTAEAGGEAMDRSVQNIFTLRETVAETAKKVKRLGESSQKISKVASLIEQIALQTNLLAINAGIEAARAGEQGQGFAVVAEEVGELATRSTAATKEIEQIVENIQQETAEVVEAMEVGTTQVVEGTHLVEDAKQSLTQILEVSRQIDVLVQSISTATVSQVETSQAVTELMKQIAQVSERTSNSTRQVSGSLQETVGIAQELQASVGAFKVGD
jgi:methyl-accepting chemotaxis protein